MEGEKKSLLTLENEDLGKVDIMTVKTMIETAFGDIEENKVNFKLIQTVLYLLARQLRILDRRVAYEGPFATLLENLPSIRVTELKIHALKGKKDKEDKRKGRGKRTDSFDGSPKPSSDNMDREKLLIVERVSSTNQGNRSPPMLSVVTQEEFQRLARVVRSLQVHYATKGYGETNPDILEKLRRDASFTEAIAALQLSARLGTAENILGRMTQILTVVIGVSSGLDVDSETRAFLRDNAIVDDDDVLYPPQESRIPDYKEVTEGETEAKPEEPAADAESDEGEFVTQKRLMTSMKALYDDLIKKVTDATTLNTTNATQALKTATSLALWEQVMNYYPDDNFGIDWHILPTIKIDNRLTAVLKVTVKMEVLEKTFSTFAERVTAIDAGLSAQMTRYQEQVSRMQHDLEIGLDAMADAMANTGGDAVAMAELTNNILSLQGDYAGVMFRQQLVSDALESLKSVIADLWKLVEMLRETKSDRDEVTEALKDKAGIRDLNGLVTLDQFNAVTGDFEKRIETSYNKFNNQEIIWQKSIDDVSRDLNEKGTITQLNSVKAEILKHFETLKAHMKFIADIIGEPKTALLLKRLFRDSACLCCSNPVTKLVENKLKPPDFGKKREDENTQIGDGDTRPCYFGLPVIHPVDPRAHLCQRFCGGSHTMIPSGPPKVPPSFIIKTIHKETTELGTDGKPYKVEENWHPCVPCNEPDILDPPPSPLPFAEEDL